MNKYWLTLGMIISFEVILWIGHTSKNMLAPSIGLVIGGLLSLIILTIQERKEKVRLEKQMQEWQKQMQEQMKSINELREQVQNS